MADRVRPALGGAGRSPPLLRRARPDAGPQRRLGRHGGGDRRQPGQPRVPPRARAALDVRLLPAGHPDGGLRPRVGGRDAASLRVRDRPARRLRAAAVGRAARRRRRVSLPRQRLLVAHLGCGPQARRDRVVRHVARALVLAEPIRRRSHRRQRRALLAPEQPLRLLRGRARLQPTELAVRRGAARPDADGPADRARAGRRAAGARQSLHVRDGVPPDGAAQRRHRARAPVLAGVRSVDAARDARRGRPVDRAHLRERGDRASAQRHAAGDDGHRGARASLGRPQRGRRSALRRRFGSGR